MVCLELCTDKEVYFKEENIDLKNKVYAAVTFKLKKK